MLCGRARGLDEEGDGTMAEKTPAEDRRLAPCQWLALALYVMHGPHRAALCGLCHWSPESYSSMQTKSSYSAFHCAIVERVSHEAWRLESSPRQCVPIMYSDRGFHHNDMSSCRTCDDRLVGVSAERTEYSSAKDAHVCRSKSPYNVRRHEILLCFV